MIFDEHVWWMQMFIVHKLQNNKCEIILYSGILQYDNKYKQDYVTVEIHLPNFRFPENSVSRFPCPVSQRMSRIPDDKWSDFQTWQLEVI